PRDAPSTASATAIVVRNALRLSIMGSSSFCRVRGCGPPELRALARHRSDHLTTLRLDQARAKVAFPACIDKGDSLTAVAKPRRKAVDRQVDATLGALVGLAGSVPAQQLDLQMIERIEIRKAIANAALERRI